MGLPGCNRYVANLASRGPARLVVSKSRFAFRVRALRSEIRAQIPTYISPAPGRPCIASVFCYVSGAPGLIGPVRVLHPRYLGADNAIRCARCPAGRNGRLHGARGNLRSDLVMVRSSAQLSLRLAWERSQTGEAIGKEGSQSPMHTFLNLCSQPIPREPEQGWEAGDQRRDIYPRWWY